MTGNVKRFDVLNPIEGKDGKTWWTKIGVLFENPNGTFSGSLEQFPLNGRVVVRTTDQPPEGRGKDSQ